MIMTVTELRNYLTTNKTDDVLEAELAAIESAIRKETNNPFQNRAMRCISEILDGAIVTPSPYFAEGDTVQVTKSQLNNGLYVIGTGNSLSPSAYNCESNMITKVEYPPDVKMGVVRMMKWSEERGDKVGIASETISRHSVTFSDLTGDNSLLGFPKALMGFLSPYRRARFE